MEFDGAYLDNRWEGEGCEERKKGWERGLPSTGLYSNRLESEESYRRSVRRCVVFRRILETGMLSHLSRGGGHLFFRILFQ